MKAATKEQEESSRRTTRQSRVATISLGSWIVLGLAPLGLGWPLQIAQAADLTIAQTPPPNVPPALRNLPNDVRQELQRSRPNLGTPVVPPLQPSPSPLPQAPLPTLPPPNELLPAPSQPASPELPGEVPSTIFVKQFQVIGSTAFSPEELAAVARRAVLGDRASDATSSPAGPEPEAAGTAAEPSPSAEDLQGTSTENVCPQKIDTSETQVDQSLSFAQLLQARSAITQLYIDCGYITSGAYIPPQTIENGIVQIQVIEGKLEEINVTGLQHLDPGYVRSRLAIAGSAPLNRDRLLQGLQLLQLNPLIRTISADLQAGTRPGTSVLAVQVAEANPLSAAIILDNNRSPSVGTFERQIQFLDNNLFGIGDSLSLAYINTDGSNEFDGSYTIPINPRNGTLQIAGGFSSNRVIEPPFDILDITSDYNYIELTLRQPIIQTPTEELALGLNAIRQYSQTSLGYNNIGPFPLSPGADERGRTRITALRFFQEWTKRDSQQVFAARSQFSLGLNLFDATVNSDGIPDSRFFGWRGQAQWVRLLAPDTIFLIRGDVQLTGDPLLPVEQFSLGGDQTVRGYRQDYLLTDSGALLSTEFRIPILRVPSVQGVLQIVPFLDVGTGWNNRIPNPDPSTLVGTGVGLLWQMSDVLSARIDYGIPLVSVESRDRTWQEQGIYFSVTFTPF